MVAAVSACAALPSPPTPRPRHVSTPDEVLFFYREHFLERVYLQHGVGWRGEAAGNQEGSVGLAQRLPACRPCIHAAASMQARLSVPAPPWLARHCVAWQVEVRPGDTVLDVGANIGMFAMAVAEVRPGVGVEAIREGPEGGRSHRGLQRLVRAGGGHASAGHVHASGPEGLLAASDGIAEGGPPGSFCAAPSIKRVLASRCLQSSACTPAHPCFFYPPHAAPGLRPVRACRLPGAHTGSSSGVPRERGAPCGVVQGAERGGGADRGPGGGSGRRQLCGGGVYGLCGVS